MAGPRFLPEGYLMSEVKKGEPKHVRLPLGCIEWVKCGRALIVYVFGVMVFRKLGSRFAFGKSKVTP